MPARTLFLDLDGALADSRPGITRCIVHALPALVVRAFAGGD